MTSHSLMTHDSIMTHSSALTLPTPWIPLRDAWTRSPWSSKTLLAFAKRGVLEARLENGQWSFEPQGFYMAMREELALEQWQALRDVARRYDVDYDALVSLVKTHTLYALYTDTDWYIEPDEAGRIPHLMPDAWTPTPHHPHRDAQSAPRQQNLPLAPHTPQDEARTPPHLKPPAAPQAAPEWVRFKLAVRQSAFTHSELYHAVNTGQVDSMRHPDGHLLVCTQSLEAYTPDARWMTYETFTLDMSPAAKRLIFRQMRRGERASRLMGGVWYLCP